MVVYDKDGFDKRLWVKLAGVDSKRRTKLSRRTIPMNCMDRSVLAIHEVNEPYLIHALLDLEGDIDSGRLQQAIASAQMAYPVMRTVLRGEYLSIAREIQEDLGGGVLTVSNSAERQEVDYETCLLQWMNKPLDLRKEFPMRVLLLQRNEVQSTLAFTFHHSAADGLRAVFFIRKIIEYYNGVADANPPDDIRISRKGDPIFELAQSHRARVNNYYLKMAYDILYRLVLSAIRPPSRVYHDRSGRSRDTFFCNAVIGHEQLTKLEAKANSAGVEVNDILLASCYRTVDTWNRMHGKTSNKVRVMAVVNASPKAFRQVIANQMSWISPTTWPKDRADQAGLLKRLRSQTLASAKDRRAFSLIYIFYFVTLLPPVIHRQVFRLLVFLRTHVDSIFFTNLGVIWPSVGSDKPAITHIGQARICNFTGSGPVTTPWRLAFGAITYNKTLNISLTYRPSMFSKENVQQLLDLYVDEVTEYQARSDAAPVAVTPVESQVPV
jgi:NRPS condensation-like uncharacterized protein